MKPVDSWTQEEQSEFMHLFAKVRILNIAKVGETVFTFPRKEKAFFEVKSFMEKEWPELWEEYLRYYLAHHIGIAYLDERDKKLWTLSFNEVFDLTNLIAFLFETENVKGWGWVECNNLKCKIGSNIKTDCIQNIRTCLNWEENRGKCGSRLKHPAKLYVEGLK